MKTIEERALDIASYAYDFKGKADVESLKGNLALQIRNALAEQKRDDIEKACGLLHEVLTHFFRRGTPLEELKHNEEVFRKRMMKD